MSENERSKIHIDSKMLANIDAVEQKIEYKFLDKSFIAQALTHSSYANEAQNTLSNERLEFLGDAILELCVSDYLYRQFSDCNEGNLTKLRAGVVCEGNLSKIARILDLGQHLLFGIGASQNASMRANGTLLCDLVEALIAAIYLDSGMKNVNDFIMKFVIANTELNDKMFSPNDYKGRLQELLQRSGACNISYSILSAEGPDHDKLFKAQVSLEGRILADGIGKSKKEAEQNAAQNYLLSIGEL
ncbi:MAG: ribonuclease III [Defluviitaleaceae bacterium]|nr:ribonuclease III [Defluviitaleaceae bacterium]